MAAQYLWCIFVLSTEKPLHLIKEAASKIPVAYIDDPDGFAENVEFGGTVRWRILFEH